MFKIYKRKKKLTNEQELYQAREKRFFKHHFKKFFTGTKYSTDGSWLEEPIVQIDILKFGITDIEFDGLPTEPPSEPTVVKMIIILECPGLLIGKGGRLIHKVERHLDKMCKERGDENFTVKIDVRESKLWENVN